MEVAAFLLFACLVELVVTVYCVVRVRVLVSELHVMQDTVSNLGRILGDVAAEQGKDVPLPASDAAVLGDAVDVLSSASPADLEKAAQLVAALGLTKD